PWADQFSNHTLARLLYDLTLKSMKIQGDVEKLADEFQNDVISYRNTQSFMVGMCLHFTDTLLQDTMDNLFVILADELAKPYLERHE
ncbi:hypothetical protein M3M33_14955, partial [Loigolactobacillus coryniformis]|uniref:hypothetical protein n=1 Tax=Loigolactobacillus coryniformis TaxID=1610 RepID=UPI00201A9F91